MFIHLSPTTGVVNLDYLLALYEETEWNQVAFRI